MPFGNPAIERFGWLVVKSGMRIPLFLAAVCIFSFSTQPELLAQQRRVIMPGASGFASEQQALDHNVKVTIEGEYWEGLPLNFSLTGTGQMATSFPNPDTSFEAQPIPMDDPETLRVSYRLTVSFPVETDNGTNFDKESLSGEALIRYGHPLALGTNGRRKLTMLVEKVYSDGQVGKAEVNAEGAVIGGLVGTVGGIVNEGEAEGALIGAAAGIIEDESVGAAIGGLVGETTGGYIATGTFVDSAAPPADKANEELLRQIAEMEKQLSALREQIATKKEE